MYEPIKIFIASPGDLSDERKKFVDIISEVNIIKAHTMGYHLEPLGWEDTLLGVGRPQQLINEDLKKSDLFIMLLWKRWGSHTGKYSSGTEEEYNVALELYNTYQKPEIWLYFKNNDKSNLNEDTEKINKFKGLIEEENVLLYKKFSDITEWGDLLRNNLCIWLDTKQTNNKKVIDDSNDIYDDKVLIEVSCIDFVPNTSPEIQFTIVDEISFDNWKKLDLDSKKLFIYRELNKHLYLTLGSNPYRAIMRYRLDETRYLLLGKISMKYGSTIEECTFYIPSELNLITKISKEEKNIIDFHD